MTVSAATLDRIADLVLDRLQITSADIALEMGRSTKAIEHYLRELSRQGRVHRIPHRPGSGARRDVWAAGRAPEGESLIGGESVHLTVRTWKAGSFRTSWLEAYFFGRIPKPTLLGAAAEMAVV